MKKIITSLLVVVLLVNFIFSTNYSLVFAVEKDEKDGKSNALEEAAPVSNTIVSEIGEYGTVSQTQGSATKLTLSLGSLGASGIGMLTGVIARVINIFIIQVDIVMSTMTITEETKNGTSAEEFWYTIDRTVFNRIALFNIDYFNTDPTYSVGNIDITADPNNISIKEGISKAYYICRLLSLIIAMLVLIYIGIRMALSTVASDQAKFKKMLVAWVESIVLMFMLIYIISAVIAFGEMLTGIFFDMREQLINPAKGYDIFENTIRGQTLEKVKDQSGLQLTMWSIVYWVLLFTELKFFWLYSKRLLMIGLLITISPLITITYPIDKAGDGKAQVFSFWLREFIMNVLIQPLHALIYLIFILTANSIASKSPILAIAMFMVMGSVERMVKVVFDMRNIATLRGINKFLTKGG